MTTIIAAQGHLLQAKQYSGKHVPMKGGGIRGSVYEFSRQSRKRLLQLVATLEVRHRRVVFLTLTHHDFPTYAQAKRNLRAFFERVRRRFRGVSAIWRMELQERGSVHFHIMFFNLPFWKNIDIQKYWTEITGEDTSGIKIELMHNHKHAMIYIGKYVAKTQSSQSKAITLQSRIEKMAYSQRNAKIPQALLSEDLPKLDNGTYPHELGETGRHWGFFCKNLLPFAERKVAVIRDEQMERYLFWMLRAESRNRAAKGSSAFLFTDDALEALKWANNGSQQSGKGAYSFLRYIQKGITHAERIRSKMAYKPRHINMEIIEAWEF